VGVIFHEIYHTVCVNGADVLAAGEGTVTGNVARINNHTGHYKVNRATLKIAKEAFRRAEDIQL
jgi:ribosomal protein L16/L10AE